MAPAAGQAVIERATDQLGVITDIEPVPAGPHRGDALVVSVRLRCGHVESILLELESANDENDEAAAEFAAWPQPIDGRGPAPNGVGEPRRVRTARRLLRREVVLVGHALRVRDHRADLHPHDVVLGRV